MLRHLLQPLQLVKLVGAVPAGKEVRILELSLREPRLFLSPELFLPGEFWGPGGAHEIEQSLDSLIRLAGSDDCQQPRSRLQRVRSDICSDCANEFPGGRCFLRDSGRCVIDRFADLILFTIAEKLP